MTEPVRDLTNFLEFISKQL